MRQPSELRSYQQRIITHLYENNAAFTLARPGYGKTVSALTAFLELRRDGVARHAIVVAPRRVATVTWPGEILGWVHTSGLKYAVLDGPPAKRAELLKAASSRDLTLIGIDNVKWLLEQMRNLPADHPLWDILILDEVSKFKNPRGVRFKALAKEVNKWKIIWGLSGTLRPNSSMDLWAPARLVTRGALWSRSFDAWRKERYYPKDQWGYQWLPFPGVEDQLNTELAPYVATIHENELIQLPRLSVLIDYVDLPGEARVQYETMQKKLFAEILEEGDTVLAVNKAVATGKLAQLANGFLMDYGAMHQTHTAKREWLQDLHDDNSENVLVAYEYVEDLKMLREVLGDYTPHLGGGTTPKDDDHNIRAWNEGKLRYLAVQYQSASHGLNMQLGGSTIWMISPTWSAENHEQLIARVHRSGQTKPVIVRICAATKTVDDMKLMRVHNKMTAQQAFETYLRNHGVRK
jgi:SNF2 family DNA or RNA helicase